MSIKSALSPFAIQLRDRIIKQAYASVPRWSSQETSLPPLAVAVSGGVDSMALAFLCRHAELHRPGSIKCHALVVDHQVRPTSTTEACEVAKRLRCMGLKVNVLQLQKGHYKKSNLESVLRTRRFQALGHACRHLRVESLLLAHHADDQAETVMIRIVNQHTGDGLAGIKGSADIPECYGIYGVYRSSEACQRDTGSEGTISRIICLRFEADQLIALPSADRTETITKPSFLFPSYADGGVKVYRPFLAVPKAKLTKLCQDHVVPWTEDETNRDRTLTMRNAIRHMSTHYKLPSALYERRLNALAASVRGRIQSRHRDSRDVFGSRLKVSKVDGTGSLTLDHSSEINSMPVSTVAEGLRQAAEMVGPLETIPLSSLLDPARRIQKSFGHSLIGDSKPDADDVMCEADASHYVLDRFTAAGLLWTSYHIRSPARRGCVKLEFHRMPFKRSEQPQETIWSPSSSSLALDRIVKCQGDWHFWDGRYWIRVISKHSRPVLLRTSNANDWRIFLRSLKRKDAGQYRHIDLKARYTTPALVDPVDHRLMALPSFGWMPPGMMDELIVETQFKSQEPLEND